MPVDLVHEIIPFLLDLFERYGLIAMFIMLVIDGAMFFPIPGEAIMVMAVSQHAHTPRDLVFVTSLATVAGILGSLILYTVSRVGGRPLVERHPRLFMMDRRRREKLESTFQHPLGQSLVCFLRVIPLTRIVVNIPAGLARMGVVRFLILSSIGLAVFHGGFMWLAYESQQTGSVVAEQTNTLQETYATPVWQYLQANEVIAIIAALTIGAWLSYRSSRRMMKHPRGALTSILGWLTVRLLVFGTLALWGALVYDPEVLYDLAFAGGLDVPAIAAQLGLEPVRSLAYAGVVTWSVGMILWGLESVAKARRDKADTRGDEGDGGGGGESPQRLEPLEEAEIEPLWEA